METLLKQISSDVQNIKTDIQNIKTDIQNTKTDIQNIKTDITPIKEGQIRLEQKVDGIYQSVVRIEEGQPKDIFAMLENIDCKLDTSDSEITVLNKRIFKVEAGLERL